MKIEEERSTFEERFAYASLYPSRSLREAEACGRGFLYVAGVDEAGRGPLAGPVAVAACILGRDFMIRGLNDSKKLTEKKRESLFPLICETAFSYAISFVSPADIEEKNILQSVREALFDLRAKLSPKADFFLIDSFRPPESFPVASFSFDKADQWSVSVSAASVLAKVARDRYMKRLAEQFPEYELAKHKGYGTPRHYAKLDELGPAPFHRPTFLRSWFARRGLEPEFEREKLRKFCEEHPRYYRDLRTEELLPELRLWK